MLNFKSKNRIVIGVLRIFTDYKIDNVISNVLFF
jgi:hypothetical protein